MAHVRWRYSTHRDAAEYKRLWLEANEIIDARGRKIRALQQEAATLGRPVRYETAQREIDALKAKLKASDEKRLVGWTKLLNTRIHLRAALRAAEMPTK